MESIDYQLSTLMEFDVRCLAYPFLDRKTYLVVEANEKLRMLNAGIKINFEKVKAFETAFLSTLRKKNNKALTAIKAGQLTDEVIDTLNKVAEETSKAFE